MNNEEATYKFRRTVAQVLKTLADSDRLVQARRRSALDISEEQDEERDDDG